MADLPLSVLVFTDRLELKTSLEKILVPSRFVLEFESVFAGPAAYLELAPDLVVLDACQGTEDEKKLREFFRQSGHPLLLIERAPHLAKNPRLKKEKKFVTMTYPIVNNLLIEALDYLGRSVVRPQIIFDPTENFSLQMNGELVRVSDAVVELSCPVAFPVGAKIRLVSAFLASDEKIPYKILHQGRFSVERGQFLNWSFIKNQSNPQSKKQSKSPRRSR